MALYRLTLLLTAPLGTPMTGPTLFGRLCWLVRETEGEAALAAWLADPARMWRLSDAFPAGCLPRPLGRPRPLSSDQLKSVKELKKRPMLRRETWLQRRAAWDDAALDPERDLCRDAALFWRTAHNTIDRRTGKTLEAGGLYFTSEDWRFVREENRWLDLYVECHDTPDRVRWAFEELGREGYGRDASTGRGRWDVLEFAEDRDLMGTEGDRRMSLSSGFLTPETMADAYWRLEPLFGKAGPQLAASGISPFKHPVLLTKPGMTFRPLGEGPWGRWLTGVHPERPEIGVNGLHLAIRFAEQAT